MGGYGFYLEQHNIDRLIMVLLNQAGNQPVFENQGWSSDKPKPQVKVCNPTILDNWMKIKTTPPPILMMEKWRNFALCAYSPLIFGRKGDHNFLFSSFQDYTPYSKMATILIFFCLHSN